MPDETPPPQSLVPMRRSIVRYSSTEYQRHTDFSYSCLEDTVLSGADLYQSLFGGAILRNCSFSAVSFSRSDLNGTRIERTQFVDCDLTSCDIRFANFGNATFIRCRFEGALIHHCSLINTVFDECSFENGVIDGNVFEACTMRRCTVYRSSHINNKTFGSHYEQVAFDQGSLMYWIARDCTFSDCSIGMESAGMVYGLSRTDLEQLAYLFPGEEAPRATTTEGPEIVMREYAERGWAIGLAVLKINLGFTSIAYAFKEYFDFLLRSDVDILNPPREELSFLVDVFDELARDRRLPLLSCWDALRYLRVGRRAMANTSETAAREIASLALLITRVELLASTLLRAFDESLSQMERSMDTPLLVELTFERRPGVDSVALMTEAVVAAELPCDLPPQVISARSGSHLELIATCGSGLFALRLLLMGVRGCLVEVDKLRVTIADLKMPVHRTAPRRRRKPGRSRYLARARTAVEAVVKFVGSLVWLSDPHLKGWDENNLRRVSAIRLPTKTRRRRVTKTVRKTKTKT